MHGKLRSLIGVLAVALVATAGCSGDGSKDSVAAGQGSTSTSDERPGYAVAGFYDEGPKTFESLSDLVSQSEVVALFEVSGERDGRDTAKELPDVRTVQRILDLKAVEPIKGVDGDETIPMWHGTWTLVPSQDGGWDRQTLAVTTDDYEIKVGQQVLMGLVRDSGEPSVYVVQSSSSYFVIDAEDSQSFEQIPRTNDEAASQQQRSVDEVIEEMRAAARG